jgi:hypothetical protein
MIAIYRKIGNKPKPKKLTKAEQATLNRRLELVCRVQRPELVEFFVSQAFYKLPALPTATIDNKGIRLLEHESDCFIVPNGSLGRKGIESIGIPAKERSTAQSILLWIKQNLGDVVNADEVSVVVQ